MSWGKDLLALEREWRRAEGHHHVVVCVRGEQGGQEEEERVVAPWRRGRHGPVPPVEVCDRLVMGAVSRGGVAAWTSNQERRRRGPGRLAGQEKRVEEEEEERRRRTTPVSAAAGGGGGGGKVERFVGLREYDCCVCLMPMTRTTVLSHSLFLSLCVCDFSVASPPAHLSFAGVRVRSVLSPILLSLYSVRACVAVVPFSFLFLSSSSSIISSSPLFL